MRPSFLITAVSAVLLTSTVVLHAQDSGSGLRLSLVGGRSLPLESVTYSKGVFTVTKADAGLNAGQTFDAKLAESISGDAPPALAKAEALLFLDDARGAIKLLEPILTSQKASAPVAGNFWVEAAHIAAVAYAVSGDAAKAKAVVSDIKDLVPGYSGTTLGSLVDTLGSTKRDTKAQTLGSIAKDEGAPLASALATYFLGQELKLAKKNREAIEAYLTVSSIFSDVSRTLNAASEFRAAELISMTSKGRDEGVKLFQAAAQDGPNTAIAEAAQKRLASAQ